MMSTSPLFSANIQRPSGNKNVLKERSTLRNTSIEDLSLGRLIPNFAYSVYDSTALTAKRIETRRFLTLISTKSDIRELYLRALFPGHQQYSNHSYPTITQISAVTTLVKIMIRQKKFWVCYRSATGTTLSYSRFVSKKQRRKKSNCFRTRVLVCASTPTFF